MQARAPQELPGLKEQLLAHLRRRVLDLLEAHDQCLHELTEPHVHALRLAMRHLQPLLEVCQAWAFHERAADRTSERIRELLHLTGPLRDAQLRGIALRTELRAGALLSGLLRQVEREERSQLRKVAAQIKDLDRDRLVRLVASTSPKHTSAAARLALRRTVAHRKSRLQLRISQLRPDDPTALHRARIALKRYRYLVDAFAHNLPTVTQAHRVRLERNQERLGAWHDERTMADWLFAVGDHLQPVPRKHCLALAQVKTARAVREQQLLVAAMARTFR